MTPPRPPDPAAEKLGRAAARDLLAEWGHPHPDRWLDARVPGDPVDSGSLWRALLEDECMKLYNQAWCALEQIREAGARGEAESTWMLAMDDFPSAIEQAFALAPEFAREHLELLRSHRPERYEDFLRELAVGTPREAEERREALRFWLHNATNLSPLRRTLFRSVCEVGEP